MFEFVMGILFTIILLTLVVMAIAIYVLNESIDDLKKRMKIQENSNGRS